MPRSNSMRRLVKRSEFLRAARGKRAGRAAFSLQIAESASEEPGVGFTVTKKMGNAPQRNRIKRRLRAAVAACAPAFRPRHDYVLVGRTEALGADFSRLLVDLEALIAKLHAGPVPQNEAKGLRNQAS